MKEKLLFLVKRPTDALFLFLVIACCYELITNYNEYSTKNIVITTILVVILIWVIVSDYKNFRKINSK
jgi:hypothetical protein